MTARLVISEHDQLGGLADDDHVQYLTEARHDALAADNPHAVTFTQAVTADAGTDITAAEAETLTDGSNADALHAHGPIDGADHGLLVGLGDDDHTQYLLVSGARALGGNWSLGGNNLTSVADFIASGAIRFFPSGDADDGMSFETASDIPHILPVGGEFLRMGNTTAEPTLEVGANLARAAAVWPLGRTFTSNTPGDWLDFPGTYVIDLVNGSIGGLIAASGTFQFDTAGSAVGAGNLFKFSGMILGNNVSFGSQYTFVNTGIYRADTGALSSLFVRNGLYQMTYDTVNGGTLAITTANPAFFSNPTVASGVTISNLRHCEFNTGSGWTGTVDNNDLLYVPAVVGGTNMAALRSILASGANRRLINHTGTAISVLAGDLHMNDGVSLVLGSEGGNRVELLRSAAGTMRMIGVGGTANEGLDWDFDPAFANSIDVTSSTGAGLGLNLDAVSIGTVAAVPGGSFFLSIAGPAVSVPAGSDYAVCLNSTSGLLTLAGNVTTLAQWIVNAPSIALGGNILTDAANMVIQTSVSEGDNRYGLLITSNPTGASGENAALCVRNGPALLQDDLQHEGTLAGLYSATPVAQHSSTGQTAGFTAGVGASVLVDSTFTGGTGATAYTIGDVVRALKLIGIMAS